MQTAIPRLQTQGETAAQATKPMEKEPGPKWPTASTTLEAGTSKEMTEEFSCSLFGSRGQCSTHITHIKVARLQGIAKHR